MRHALPYAVGIAVSPLPIAFVLLLLSGPRGRARAAGFAAGWAVGLAATVSVLVVLVNRLDVQDSHPAWIGAANVAVGVGFLAAAAQAWRGPQLMAGVLGAIDHLTPARSAISGVVMSSVNPKVYALTLGAALALATTGATTGTAAATTTLYVAIGATGVILPVGVDLAAPVHSAHWLESFRAWLETHERTILIVLGVLIGVVFLRQGIATLR